MRSPCIMILGACARLLVGCAQYQPQPISPAAEAAAFNARTLANPRLREVVTIGTALAGTRASRFSWDLDRLTFAAMYYQPRLDIARAKLASARAGAITAAQIKNPLLDIGGFYNGTVLTPSPWNARAMVDFLLETFGKREDRIAQADALADAARHDLATATWQVRTAVRTALLDLWAAMERVKLTKQRLDDQKQLVDLLEARLKAGQAASLDVTRERISRNQIALALGDAQEQMADARVQLATAIGIPVRALDGVKLSFAAFDKPASIAVRVTAGYVRRLALIDRSDVKALLAEYAAAQSALKLATADQYQNLTLGPGYEFDQGSNKWSLAGSVDLPIFNQNQGPIAQASANRREAAARFMALQAQIVGAVDTTLAGYRVATHTVSAADSLLADEHAHLREVSQSFSAGAVGRVDLLSARLELAAVELSRFEAIVKRRQVIGTLEDALQQPLFDPGIRLFVSETDPRHFQAESAL